MGFKLSSPLDLKSSASLFLVVLCVSSWLSLRWFWLFGYSPLFLWAFGLIAFPDNGLPEEQA
jgi:hypothetical protein